LSDTSRKILMNAAKLGRVPNAYLFSGTDANVLLNEALTFASSLNNSEEDRRKIAGGIHPDVLVVSGQTATIKIDQVRELTSFTRNGPSLAEWKIVIIDRADRMTEEAANSFLKALEEPAGNVLSILTTTRENKILRTIFSRCQKISFQEEKSIDDPEALEIAGKLHSVPQMDIPALLEFSEELSSGEDLENKLRSALSAYRESMTAGSREDFISMKSVFHAIGSLERHANKRLAMDNMLLSMKGVS
jgi:DNA polymerase III delta prime subunit